MEQASNTSVIRKARMGEQSAIHLAHMRSIREVCIKMHGPEEVRGWGNRPQGDRWTAAIGEGLVWVVECAEIICGVGMISPVKDQLRVWSLHALYLTPEAMGQGWGERMLFTLMDECKARGAKMIKLGSSLTGHGFYKKYGFVDSGPMVREDIGGSPVSCIPMTYSFPES